MRDIFPAHFRPTADELAAMWKVSTFAVDANVLLNLYRYSPETRVELENALKSIESRLFLPHQAAKEFLRNRLGVTASQADEYTRVVKTISDMAVTLADRKRHPFLPENELPAFNAEVAKLKDILEQQRETLLARLTKDEILEFLEKLFSGKTGGKFDEPALAAIVAEGEQRYQGEVPPGYKDGKKDTSGDQHRRFGDLIMWKQLIARAAAQQQSLIFITDDKKEDWWLEQSGRTIGPRTELREEFMASTTRDFWMYTVDLFIEEAARVRNKPVSQQVIDEIKTVREEVQLERQVQSPSYPSYRVITHDEMLKRIADSERWAKANAEGFVGLHSFVINHLGRAGYDYTASFDTVAELEKQGVIEIYDHQGAGHARPVRAVRMVRGADFSNRPFEVLAESATLNQSAG